MKVFCTTSKSLLLLILLISVLIPAIISCKKNSDPQPNEPEPRPNFSSVSISGTDYPAVTIGNQRWTASNYAGPGGIAFRDGTEKPEYGRYYTFEEAKAVRVPTGWRIPTMQDYIALAENQGVVFTNQRATAQEAIKKLVSKTNWRTIPGSNSSGFNAYPAGYSFKGSKPLDGDISEFWMADGNTVSFQEGASGQAHNLSFYSTGNEPGYRFNLRFVRDN